MKKYLFVMAFSFLFLFSFNNSTEAASFTHKEGDVLTVTASIYGQYLGHSGIIGRSADGKLYAVHIGGPGKPIEKMTISSWYSKYPKTTVTRYKDSTIAQKAGQKSMDFIRYYGGMTGYSASYDLTGKALVRLDKSVTYCTKLVWQSYYFGASVNLGYYPTFNVPISPYHFRDNATGFTTVYKNF